MRALFTDLDNTLIYSYKHDIGNDKINVEIYQGREISFITGKTSEYLEKLMQNITIIPITTRTLEQYNRINLGIGDIEYALVCNGGILLEKGCSNTNWYNESLKMISDSRRDLLKAIEFLEKEEQRYFEIRFIDDLFVFTKCHFPEIVVEKIKKQLDCNLVDVFNNGDKVYVVPKELNKGRALKRLKDYLKIDFAIAAGDSEFDIPMLKEADFAYAPFGFAEKYKINLHVEEAKENMVFSDDYLRKCLENEKQQKL